MILALLKLTLVGVWSLDDVRQKAAQAVMPQAKKMMIEKAAVSQGVRLKVLADSEAMAAEGGATEQNQQQEPAKPESVSEADWQALKTRKEELDRRARSLKALEQELDQKLERLTKMKAEIQKMLKEAQGVKDKKIKHLVSVYANMKAEQAASVIENLDQDLAVKILSGMRGRQAGEILNNVSPEQAAKLSEELTRLHVPFEDQ